MLPNFKFHPDPIVTKAIAPSNDTCACCNEKRGYIFQSNIYSATDTETLKVCPWCIADGSAALKWDATFNDGFDFDTDDTDFSTKTEEIEELNNRTPGYVSWQGSYWLSHCGSPCDFQGDATELEVKNRTPETNKAFFKRYPHFTNELDNYKPHHNHLAVYKFACIHCKMVLFRADMS